MRLGCLGQRQDPIDDGTHFVGGEKWKDVAGEQSRGDDLLVAGARAQHGAVDVEALAEHGAHVEWGSAAGDEADDDETAAGREHADVAGQVVAADQVEDDVHPASVRRGQHVFGPFVGGDDTVVQAERAGALELGGGPGRAQHARAQRPGQLDRCGAYSAAGRVDEHAFAGVQVAARHERVVRRDPRFGKRRRLDECEMLRYRQRLTFVHDDVLGVRSAAGDAHDAVADVPLGHVRCDPRHRAGVLQAGNVGRGTGRRRVPAAALEQVRAIHRGRMHLHQQLTAARLGRGALVQLQHLRRPRLADDDGFHGVAARLEFMRSRR